ncbi:hypothetical protein J2128_001604 [Methanomicrobium sp. W14]|uniref:hypothetical protein n=1 Tax=Methanomicrobium sp. W14 TaxID=2817839 RepID=UPI001AE318AD|nr:hypothetical protein [Methanomicrobium sp. W14]MBP2133650.1 hypothetical protein [Methanomicrobium sp. W14]
MRIIIFLSAVSALPSFFMMVHERLYSVETVEEENEHMTTLLLKTESSFDSFLKNIYFLAGTLALGMVADPPDAEKKADKVFDEFKMSYREFVSDFRDLLFCISSRKESLQASFGSDWVKIETLKTVFEKTEVDWEYISEKRALICDSSILNNERKYNSHLFGNLKEFLSVEAGEYKEPLSAASQSMKDMNPLNPAVDYAVNLLSYTIRGFKGD